jgi:hypothetical protein
METTKLLQYLELMKGTFDCGGNTRQQVGGIMKEIDWT